MGEGRAADARSLRDLPAVHELAAALEAPQRVAVAVAREAITERRRELLAGHRGDDDLLPRARALLARRQKTSLRQVLNATGVILHTNLGRAPLAASARAALVRISEGYSNLELDLRAGERGSRQAHVEGLLCELTGADAALVVNNGAAAVLLAAAALAGPGRAIVVSRGQLVEIGGGFRIPEVVLQSGSELVEVGTTNRTTREDYGRAVHALGNRLGAILRVHQSNFRTVGFVRDVPVEALCELGVSVVDDVGSGVLIDASTIPALGEEPGVRRSLAAGASLVCCSGDKLLGGPQAGLLLGSSEAVAAAGAHPLARALRIDKFSLAALEATLSLYGDPARAVAEIPVLAMLAAGGPALAARAESIVAGLGPERGEIVRSTAKVGGGALPLLELEGPAVALAEGRDPVALAAALREGDPPVIARVHDGRVLLDPRTLSDQEAPLVARVVLAALTDPADDGPRDGGPRDGGPADGGE